MTADDRARVRTERDRHVRKLVRLDKFIEVERDARICAHCGAPIPPERVGTASKPALYCKATHRQYAYYRRKRLAVA